MITMPNDQIGLQQCSDTQGFLIIGDVQICWGQFGATSGGGVNTWYYPKTFEKVYSVSRTADSPANDYTGYQYRSLTVENVTESSLDFQNPGTPLNNNYFIVIGKPKNIARS